MQINPKSGPAGSESSVVSDGRDVMERMRSARDYSSVTTRNKREKGGPYIAHARVPRPNLNSSPERTKYVLP